MARGARGASVGAWPRWGGGAGTMWAGSDGLTEVAPWVVEARAEAKASPGE